MEQIRALLVDMNTDEIVSHISMDNLSQWLNAWKTSMTQALDDLEEKIIPKDTDEVKEAFSVGDIVELYDEAFRGVLLDYIQDNVWRVMTENGCVESWEDNIFHSIGKMNYVKYMIEALR